MLSTSQKNAANMKVVTSTTMVVVCTSGHDGQHTFFISLRTSFRKSFRRWGWFFNCCIPVLELSVTANVLAIVLPQTFVLPTLLFHHSAPGFCPGKLAGELGFEPRS